jgi:LCP family protein required for cell wall assembly
MAVRAADPTGDAARPPETPLARHGALATSHPVATGMKVLGLSLAVLLASTAAVAGIAIWDVTTSLKPSVLLPADTSAPEDPRAPAPSIGAIDGGVNLVLVGSDSGEGNPAFGERTERLADVTLLLHIAQDHSSATVVSFPRDLFVEMPECGPTADGAGPGTGGGFVDKLNASLGYGGLGCTVAVVQQLTGMTIPYAAQIEFGGVIAMSNAVGGVPVCVTEEIADLNTGTFLTAGPHVLQGVDALQFLRTRHGLRTGSDLARIGNQQAFLASLARTIKSDGTLGNPFKLYGLAKAAASNMVLSKQLQSTDTMVSIALALADIDLERVAFLQFPVAEVGGGLEPISDDAAVLFDALAADVPVTPSGQLGQASQPDPEPPAVPLPAEPQPSDTPPATEAPSPAPTPAPTGDPTATPGSAPSAPIVLPATIPGQTAADRTCTLGRTLDQQ